MTTNKSRASGHRSAALALAFIGSLMVSACGSNPSPTIVPTAGATGGAVTAAPRSTLAGNTANHKLDCQALVNAAFDFNSGVPFLLPLESGGTAVNRVDSPLYVDTAKLRADLVVLAALPDPTEALESTMLGKPSEAIPQWRQLLDLIDAKAKAGPTPVSAATDTNSMTDQQLLSFTAKFAKMSSAISAALDRACPGVSPNVPQAQPPGAPVTALPARYSIGQTAPLGDLRVTLDRVATLAGGLPAPGSRFVFVYITVENTGRTPFQVNTLTGTHWENAAGKQYFADPFSSALDPNTTNLEGEIPSGGKRSGAIGYQLPRDVGDLVWVFADFRPTYAVFAVKAQDVVTVGTPVTELTASALRSGAAATQTAFVTLALSAATTQEAAGTATPAPPEPTETLAPPDLTATPAPPEPTETLAPPEPTATPAPPEPTEMPTANP